MSNEERDEAGAVERAAEGFGCLGKTLALVALAVLLGAIVYGLWPKDDDDKGKAETASPTTAALTTDRDQRIIAPPDPDNLPAGAELYQGSAGPIGCIPCDGKFRFLHPTNGGVVADIVGSAGQASQSMEFAKGGTIEEFGIKLTEADGGNWEFALHANGNAYMASCHVPIGSTQCRTKGLDGTPVKAGDKIAILVGNPGDPFTEGKFSASWWIVFQPD